MVKRGKLQAVFFDCNGVIVDDEPIHMRLFQEVLAEEDISLTVPEYYAAYIGMDDKGAFTHILTREKRRVTPEMIAELVGRKADLYQRAIQRELVIFPGAVRLVKALSGKIPLGLVSGALRHEIDLILISAGIRSCFQIVVSSEDFVHGKPNPEPYQIGLKRLKKIVGPLTPKSCVGIEDTVAGLESVHAAGMKCLAVATSSSIESLQKAERAVEALDRMTPDDIEALI